jgi:hypothetical protein
MKHLLKRLLKAIWNLTSPARRPLTRKLEAMIARSMPASPACRVSEETGLLMDLLVRELVRLQKHVDQLHESIEDLAPARTGLAVVGDDQAPHSAAG